MFAVRPKPFLVTDPKLPCASPFPQITQVNVEKRKPLWQRFRFFTLILSIGGGFPFWNLRSKSRSSLGQFALMAWFAAIFVGYCWATWKTVDEVYLNAYRIRWSAISLNVNVVVALAVSLRTIYTMLSNWWYRQSLAKLFSSIDELRNTLKVETSYTRCLCKLAIFVVMTGVGFAGIRVPLYMSRNDFWKIFPVISTLSMMDVIGGRSPILIFVVFAESLVDIAKEIRLRFDGLVKHSGRWVYELKDAQQIDELRILHGRLCEVIADCSSCFSTAFAVGLLSDMISIIAVLYVVFLDFLPPCTNNRLFIFCMAIPPCAVYCLSIASFIILLCVQGERLHKNVSGVTGILNQVRYLEDTELKEAVSIFASQVLTSDTAANIHSCFNIRLTLLPTVVGTIFTYLIIIVQFRQTDGIPPFRPGA